MHVHSQSVTVISGMDLTLLDTEGVKDRHSR